jgi:PhoPQ-activated pathogenicity-related protein
MEWNYGGKRGFGRGGGVVARVGGRRVGWERLRKNGVGFGSVNGGDGAFGSVDVKGGVCELERRRDLCSISAGYLLNVTSGTWLTPNASTAYVWTHQVLVCIPWILTDTTHASIWVTAGSTGQTPPSSLEGDVLIASLMAVTSGTVSVVIWQVPNQPIVFASDPSQKQRSEDDAVAWTWLEFMQNPTQSEMVLYFPMTRAVVRAMDAVEQYVPHKNAQLDIQKWFVYGASKRGWITWLTGAVASDRVVGIAPMVMDALNVRVFLEEGVVGVYRSPKETRRLQGGDDSYSTRVPELEEW